jgi:hypothetical protein
MDNVRYGCLCQVTVIIIVFREEMSFVVNIIVLVVDAFRNVDHDSILEYF